MAIGFGGLVCLATSACGGASSAETRVTEDAVEAQPAEAAQPVPPTPASAPLTESDRIALEMARGACAARDFRGLFTQMAASAAVRIAYSAPIIEVSTLGRNGEPSQTRQIAARAYRDFPIRLVDYYFKPVAPSNPGDSDEYIDIAFNQSQNDQFSVEWARVHYDGKSEGGDDLGNIIGPDGAPLPAGTHPDADGQLLFEPNANCWQLVADYRYRR
jgi:hypothetical protein